MPFKATNQTLVTAVDAWTQGSIDANSPLLDIGFGAADSTFNFIGDNFGPINNWDTTGVTDMTDLFSGKTGFNEDISGWDVTNVTSMKNMFYNARLFNQNLNNWNPLNVTTMENMFFAASAFNNGQTAGSSTQPLVWNLSALENASEMFRQYSYANGPLMSFNQPLSGWTFTELKLKDVSGMFIYNTTYNQNVDNLFKVSNKVEDVSYMFHKAEAFNQDVSNWDTSSVQNMRDMFFNAINFNQDVGNFDTANVTNMQSMFNNATAFNNGDTGDNSANPIGYWDTAKVTNMSYMFSAARAFNQKLLFSDTSKVTNMSYMFYNADLFNQEIADPSDFGGGGYLNTSEVTNMQTMFGGALKFNKCLGGFNTKKVTDMSYMFFQAEEFNDGGVTGIACWDTSNVQTMQYMLVNALKFRGKINTWDTTSVQSGGLDFMFVLDSLATDPIDIFNQGFANKYTPTASDFNKKFPERDIESFVSFDANGIANGKYQTSLYNSKTAIEGAGPSAGLSWKSWGLDAPYNVTWNVKHVDDSTNEFFPSTVADAIARHYATTSDFKTKLHIYDNGNNTEAANKEFIKAILSYTDLTNYSDIPGFENVRILYWAQGWLEASDDPYISYVQLTKPGDDYVWTFHEGIRTGFNAAGSVEKYGLIEYGAYTPLVETTLAPLPQCTVTSKVSVANVPGTSDFGQWFVASVGSHPEYMVINANNNADERTAYLQHRLDGYTVVIDGTTYLIDTNNNLYNTVGVSLGKKYDKTYYNANISPDLESPLSKLRLLDHIDSSPQTVGIYDAFVTFCDVNSNVYSYKDLYPSDLQQLFSSYFTTPGQVQKSFATGSPNFLGVTTQVAEADADYFFKLLAASFGGRTKKNFRSKIPLLQDLRLVYFERGYSNPIIDANGNEVKPGDSGYGTTYKPYVSYMHIKDNQVKLVKKDSTNLKGWYGLLHQIPFESKVAVFESEGGNKPEFKQDKTNTLLKTMIDAWYVKVASEGVEEAKKIYGDPKFWITDDVTNMEGLLKDKTGLLHPYIDYWNMKKVETTKEMFKNSSFNGPLKNWERVHPDESSFQKVTTTEGMFSTTSVFDQDIGGWNLAGAVNMKDMFKDATIFDQSNLCKWAPADENVVLTNKFGYTTTQTPMNRNGSSYGFTVPTPFYSEFGNCAPTFTSSPVETAKEGVKYTYTVITQDPDGDTVTMTATTKPDWLSFAVAPANGARYVLSGTPASSDVGNNNVVLSATDGSRITTQTFTITVSSNNPPTFTSTPVKNARQESLYSYKVTTNPDVNSGVYVTATKKPDWLEFNDFNNTLSGTPKKGIWGEYDVELTATNSNGLSTTQSFTIMVRNPVCFNAGTGILCLKNGKEQYVRVGRLMEGDQVKTLNHGYKKIVDIRKGNFKLNGLLDMGLYRMKKQGNMIDDLEMTGLHCVLVDKNDKKYADDIKRQGGLKNKKFFIDGKFRLRARESHEFQQMEPDTYTIFSFALEDEEQEQYGIWANGALVETTSRKMLEISNMIKIGVNKKIIQT